MDDSMKVNILGLYAFGVHMARRYLCTDGRMLKKGPNVAAKRTPRHEAAREPNSGPAVRRSA